MGWISHVVGHLDIPVVPLCTDHTASSLYSSTWSKPGERIREFREGIFPACLHNAFVSEKKSGLNAIASAGVGGFLESPRFPAATLWLPHSLIWESYPRTLLCLAESVLRKRRKLKGQGRPQTAQAGLPQLRIAQVP